MGVFCQVSSGQSGEQRPDPFRHPSGPHPSPAADAENHLAPGAPQVGGRGRWVGPFFFLGAGMCMQEGREEQERRWGEGGKINSANRGIMLDTTIFRLSFAFSLE